MRRLMHLHAVTDKRRSPFITAQRLSIILVVLAATASAGGLFVDNQYRDTAWAVPQSRGQDLVTLVLVLPALIVCLARRNQHSIRANLVWLGLLGYLFYTYTRAAFAYTLNILFLVYVALFSLSIFALIFGATGIDAERIKRAFDASTPKRAVIWYLRFIATMLGVLWLGHIFDSAHIDP